MSSEQRLYDALMEADWQASETELERIAFMLDSFPELEGLKDLLAGDAPNLARHLDASIDSSS